MTYTAGTDFVGLWRAVEANSVQKVEMPSLDFMISALARAGLIKVQFGGLQPFINQSTTMWFRPANPTYAGEGVLYLWDANSGSYKTATPTLFAAYITALGM